MLMIRQKTVLCYDQIRIREENKISSQHFCILRCVFFATMLQLHSTVDIICKGKSAVRILVGLQPNGERFWCGRMFRRAQTAWAINVWKGRVDERIMLVCPMLRAARFPHHTIRYQDSPAIS